MHQPVGELSGFALYFLLLQGINQFHSREEAHPLTVVLNGLNTQCSSNVRLASTGSTDKHHIVGLLDEFTAMKVAYQGFIDLAVGEVKARQVPVDRELGCLELIGNGAHFSLSTLGLEQLRQYGVCCFKGW